MTTWHDLIQQFADHQGGDWDEKTLNWYLARLKVFVTFSEAHDVTPANLTAADLNRFNGYMKRQELKYSTRTGTLTALKALLRWLYRHKHLAFNPFDDPDYKLPRKERQVREAVSLSHAQRMIREAEKDKSLIGIRDAAIMRLLLTTGLRREEVTDLRWNSIDLDTGELKIIGKFDHQRPAYLRITTLNAVKRWLAVRPVTKDPALFISLQANKSAGKIYGQLRPSALNEVLAKWRDRAGLPGVSVSPHKWRRRFATEMAKGKNPFGLQFLMGHSDIATTNGYVINEPTTLRQLLDEFGPDVSYEEDEIDSDVSDKEADS